MRHFFLRDANDFPVACIATEEVEAAAKPTVLYALSVMNPLDDFNRARAREIAQTRLTEFVKGRYDDAVQSGRGPNDPEEPWWNKVGKLEMDDGKKAKLQLMRRIAEDKTITSRVRKAAQNWIRTYKPKGPALPAAPAAT